MDNQERFSIMLVNDDVVSAFLTTCQVEESTLFSRPLVFHSVDGTFQYLQENCLDAAADERLSIPQILLIDVNLPDKDGFALVDELQQWFPDLKQRTTLCFLTCSDYPRDRKKAKEMGVDYYFEQPLSNDHIQQLREAANNKAMLIA